LVFEVELCHEYSVFIAAAVSWVNEVGERCVPTYLFSSISKGLGMEMVEVWKWCHSVARELVWKERDKIKFYSVWLQTLFLITGTVLTG
jgi:hypothetical protein